MQAESRFSTLGIETKILYGAQVTNADIIMSDGARLEHVGVTPDELLLPSSTDLAAGRDVVLARALTLAGVPTDPTKAGQLYSRSSR
jgi:C-terminal processing protease CtpA/Prc